MNTRIMAVALVAMSMLGVHAAHAQGERLDLVRVSTIGGPLQNSMVGSGFVIIVLGPPDAGSSSFAGCGDLGALDPWQAVEVVLIKPGTPALRQTMYHQPVLGVDSCLTCTGTRVGNYSNDVEKCCRDQAGGVVSCGSQDADSRIWRTTGSVIEPASAGAALFTSPVALNVDALGVVTGQPNDDGTHTVIFKTQGNPAQQVDIASYYELLPADVLRDLIDLGQDPETGEHLYFAFIEW